MYSVHSDREKCHVTRKFNDVVKTVIDYTKMPKLKVMKRKHAFTIPRPDSPTKKYPMPRRLRKAKVPDKALDKSPTTSTAAPDGCGDGKTPSSRSRTPSPSSSSLLSRLQPTPILESLRRTLSSSSLPDISTQKDPGPPSEASSGPIIVNIQDEGEDAPNVSSDGPPPSPTPPPDMDGPPPSPTPPPDMDGPPPSPTPPDDVSDSTHLSSEPGKKSRKKNVSWWFPERTEAELAEWYKENPIFYDRKRRDYKDTEKKRKLLEDKAKDIDTTCKYIIILVQLTLYINSMFTFSKQKWYK